MTPDQERRARNALISGFCAAACLWMAIGAGVWSLASKMGWIG